MSSDNLSTTTSTDTFPGFVDVGVDLAKNCFQVAYLDPKTRKLINRQLTRSKFYNFICDPKGFSKRIAVEACGASHYWCREAAAHGHKAIMIPASATSTFVQTNKSDVNDARAIWQLMHCPGIQTVRPRCEANQMLGCLLKYREKLITEKTKVSNWIRSQLYELGEITSLGTGNVIKLADEVVGKAKTDGKEWSDIIDVLSDSWHKIINAFDEDIRTVDEFITKRAEASEFCKRLMTIPFIGPVSATAIEYVMEDPTFYANGRQFAAYSGFAPRHTGTGGKITIVGVDHQGNHMLKRILFQAAMSLYMRAKTPASPRKRLAGRKYISKWIDDIALRKPIKKIVCAIANRVCRIAWAVASKGVEFDDSMTTLVRRLRQDPKGVKNKLEDDSQEYNI